MHGDMRLVGTDPSFSSPDPHLHSLGVRQARVAYLGDPRRFRVKADWQPFGARASWNS